jgi:signal transduction histidine kinase
VTASHSQTAAIGRGLVGLKAQQHSSDLHLLVIYSAIAITILAVVAVVIGWLMSGRVLRPMRSITAAARDISVTNLHQRLDLRGPDDEVKELADTVDGLLARLEGSFEAQRQFVANASHELRTPLATMRAALDVAMAKPGRRSDETAVLAERLRSQLDHMDALLGGLLSLARSQHGALTHPTTLSIDNTLAVALEHRAGTIARRELRVDQSSAGDAQVSGDPVLLARLVENLVDNAVTHNTQGGWLRVHTESNVQLVRLVVENGGPVFEEAGIEELAQPFRRLGAERTGSESGTGLGLSIVAAVAEMHGGTLTLHALPAGGLRVLIELPSAVREPAGSPT